MFENKNLYCTACNTILTRGNLSSVFTVVGYYSIFLSTLHYFIDCPTPFHRLSCRIKWSAILWESDTKGNINSAHVRKWKWILCLRYCLDSSLHYDTLQFALIVMGNWTWVLKREIDFYGGIADDLIFILTHNHFLNFLRITQSFYTFCGIYYYWIIMNWSLPKASQSDRF